MPFYCPFWQLHSHRASKQAVNAEFKRIFQVLIGRIVFPLHIDMSLRDNRSISDHINNTGQIAIQFDALLHHGERLVLEKRVLS